MAPTRTLITVTSAAALTASVALSPEQVWSPASASDEFDTACRRLIPGVGVDASPNRACTVGTPAETPLTPTGRFGGQPVEPPASREGRSAGPWPQVTSTAIR